MRGSRFPDLSLYFQLVNAYVYSLRLFHRKVVQGKKIIFFEGERFSLFCLAFFPFFIFQGEIFFLLFLQKAVPEPRGGKSISAVSRLVEKHFTLEKCFMSPNNRISKLWKMKTFSHGKLNQRRNKCRGNCCTQRHPLEVQLWFR